VKDRIVIRGLELWCRLGVPKEERAEPQRLRAHLILEVGDFPEDDDLVGTVDYKAVADRLREVAATGERKLLETLARQLAALVLGEFAVSRVRVELEKFILPETDWVGVVIERVAGERI
jgi:dihydroneopterin aldolase